MATDRLQEFTLEGRDFVYMDLSGFRELREYRSVTDPAAEAIARHPEGSVLTITNISDVGFDTEVQRLIAKFMAANKPFVKYAAVIGADSIKMMMLKAIFMMSKRKNVVVLDTKDEAIAWLLRQP